MFRDTLRYLSRCLLYYLTLYRDRYTTCFVSYIINRIFLKIVLEFYLFFIKGNITGLLSQNVGAFARQMFWCLALIFSNWLLLPLLISSSGNFKWNYLNLKTQLPFLKNIKSSSQTMWTRLEYLISFEFTQCRRILRKPPKSAYPPYICLSSLHFYLLLLCSRHSVYCYFVHNNVAFFNQRESWLGVG